LHSQEVSEKIGVVNLERNLQLRGQLIRRIHADAVVVLEERANTFLVQAIRPAPSGREAVFLSVGTLRLQPHHRSVLTRIRAEMKPKRWPMGKDHQEFRSNRVNWLASCTNPTNQPLQRCDMRWPNHNDYVWVFGCFSPLVFEIRALPPP
jgi:hypothetical protein